MRTYFLPFVGHSLAICFAVGCVMRIIYGGTILDRVINEFVPLIAAVMGAFLYHLYIRDCLKKQPQ